MQALNGGSVLVALQPRRARQQAWAMLRSHPCSDLAAVLLLLCCGRRDGSAGAGGVGRGWLCELAHRAGRSSLRSRRGAARSSWSLEEAKSSWIQHVSLCTLPGMRDWGVLSLTCHQSRARAQVTTKGASASGWGLPFGKKGGDIEMGAKKGGKAEVSAGEALFRVVGYETRISIRDTPWAGLGVNGRAARCEPYCVPRARFRVLRQTARQDPGG
jgi:hypothetical protein